MHVDIVIVGAGPAGLSLARALADLDLQIAVVDPADDEALAGPQWDGREIALTHGSRRIMEKLDLWRRVEPEEISLIKDAWVFDGEIREPLRVTHEDGKADHLGFLISNHLIRRAAWQAARESSRIHWLTGRRVEATRDLGSRRSVELSDGTFLEALLVVAADGRFSATRRAVGIGARMRDYGKTMLVTRVELDEPHDHIAWEWFGHDRTVALLPLNGRNASTVITLPHERIEGLRALDETDFNREVTALYRERLGEMRLLGERHVYPLVGVLPDRLCARRFACIGDAAVGMHPVTAHGFNLGITGVEILADEIRRALSLSGDVASPRALAAFTARFRAHSLPLYVATNTVVRLFTDNRTPARLLRRVALRAAGSLAPFRRAVARQLTGTGGRLKAPRPYPANISGP